MNIYDVRSLRVPEDWEALWFVCAHRRVRRSWACGLLINQLNTTTWGGLPPVRRRGAGPHIDPAYPRRVYIMHTVSEMRLPTPHFGLVSLVGPPNFLELDKLDRKYVELYRRAGVGGVEEDGGKL